MIQHRPVRFLGLGDAVLGRLVAARWLALAGLLGSSLTIAAAPGAQAAADQPTVVELGAEWRADPRAVRLVGRSDDGHVAFDDELDPAPEGPEGMGASVSRVRSPQGVLEESSERIGGVAGDRLVGSWTSFDPPSEVLHRQPGDDAWSRLAVPAGHTLLDYSADGLLLRPDASAEAPLSLLPWTGGAPRPVTGVPADVRPSAAGKGVSDGSLAVLWYARPDVTSGLLIVDTATSHATVVPSAEPDCPSSHGNAWAVNDGVVAWQGRDDAQGRRTLCTVAVDPVTGEPGEVRRRPGVSFGDRVYDDDYRLLPVGDEVLVSSAWRYDGTWGGDPGQPLVAVATDGSARTLARWAHSVVAATDGHVLAVTGDAPGRAAVVDLDVSDGSDTQVMPIDPVRAWHSGIAVDGARVVTVDDSGHLGGVRERTVDFAGGTAGRSRLLDSDARPGLAAGEGGTAWSKSGWQGSHSAHRSPAGVVTQSSLASIAGTDARFAVSSGGAALDSRTGSIRPPHVSRTTTALQRGVSYIPGGQVPGGPGTSVVAMDLASGTAAEIPVGCDVNEVQVAGSWMLVSCAVPYPEPGLLLVDRAGVHPPRRFDAPGEPLLGNGFLVARASDGDLRWTPLTGSLGGTWGTLAVGAVPTEAGESAVAVSRGQVPTVGWVSGRRAYAARLPGVVASAVPAPLTGVAPPTVPDVTAAGVESGVVVRWKRPPGQQIRAYHVTASATRGFDRRFGRAEVGGDADSAVVIQLANGVPYDVTVTAWNLAGRAVTSTMRATPVPAPSAPTDLNATVDPANGRVKVTWQHTASPDEEPVRVFTIETGPDSIDVPGGQRSTSLPWPAGTEGMLRMRAEGAAQGSADVLSNRFTMPATPPPAVDAVAPTARVGALPRATLSTAVDLTLAARDDVALAARPMSVRWRVGSPGRSLGGWSSPVRWQQVPTGRLRVTGLRAGQTACFSTRAADAAGNRSGWSAATCTSVALDDRALKRRGTTRKKASGAYHRKTATQLRGTRASLATSSRVANRGWILATTCARCGKVRVHVGARSYGVVDLTSRTTRHRHLLRLPGPATAKGVLRLSPVARTKPVTIDGLVLPVR